MLSYVIVRLLRLMGEIRAVTGTWMPSNYLVRWLHTDRGLPWGAPVGVTLGVVFYGVMGWSYGNAQGGSAWWWMVVLWGFFNALKFASVAATSPFAWLRRTRARRMARPVRRWPEPEASANA